MVRGISLQKHSTRQTLVESIVVLSAWRLKRTWFLLSFIALGIGLGLSGDVFGSGNGQGSLQLLQARIDVARIPAGVFTILTVSLILFFVGLMTTLLVDDQIHVIALLRSQGASRGQIFGSFFLQSVVLSLFALIAGIPLALYTTLLLASHTLAGNQLDALNSITKHPWQTMIGLLPYTLIIVVTLITTGVALYSASRMDVLSLRSTSSRSQARPFWQRFNLDLAAGALALLG
ncbi:MAG TPA: FtsX-like permease family protein [Ktedonobacteraceae bacterium]